MEPNKTPTTILLAVLCLAISACVESQSISQPSATLEKPTMYEWIGTGPRPSLQRLAHDKLTCFQDAERRESHSMSDRWKAHLSLCMQNKGWGQKTIE